MLHLAGLGWATSDKLFAFEGMGKTHIFPTGEGVRSKQSAAKLVAGN